MVDVTTIRLAEILPISGDNCDEKEIAGISNNHKKITTYCFFDKLKLH